MSFIPKAYRNLKMVSIYLNGVKLQYVDSIKYLGVHISDTLNDHNDIIRHGRFLYAKGNLLCRKFSMCSNNVKHKLFTTFCYSMYCSQLWTQYNINSFNKIKVAYNDVYRKLFGIKRGISLSQEYLFNNVDCLKVLLRKSSLQFRNRLLTSNSTIVKAITYSVFFMFYSSFSSHWSQELFS